MSLRHQAEVVRRGPRRVTSALHVLLAVVIAVSFGVAGVPAAAASRAAVADPGSLRQQEWYLGVLGMNLVWAETKGAGVTVAVLDNGVDATVGDLQGALVPGFDATGKGGNPDVALDNEGHGTQMAVRIAGRGSNPGIIGIAPQAKILPVLVPDGLDDGGVVARALLTLSARPSPPQVVNMSFGSVGACPTSLQSAIKVAVDKGLILVASAGNDGQTGNPTEYPANCKGVVAVGAYDKTGTPWSKTERQPYVALGAPGVDLPAYDRNRTVGTADGTSDAAAIVSGSFAILRAKFPRMPSRQLVARMLATASRTYYKGPSYGESGDVLGFGFALVNQARTRKVPANAPNPIYDDLAKIGAAPSTPAATGNSSGSSPANSRPTTAHVNFPGSQSSSKKSDGSSTGVLVAIIAATVIVLLLILTLILRSRRRRRPVHTTQSNGSYRPPGQ